MPYTGCVDSRQRVHGDVGFQMTYGKGQLVTHERGRSARSQEVQRGGKGGGLTGRGRGPREMWVVYAERPNSFGDDGMALESLYANREHARLEGDVLRSSLGGCATEQRGA